MEDPEDGSDLGTSGAFSWNDTVPEAVSSSFDRALYNSLYDDPDGGDYFWDAKDNIWWTWDTADAIRLKIPRIVGKRNLGGVFAWGLGEDAPFFHHLEAVNDGLESLTWRGYGPRREL